jgi:outer membrane protein assembly factor BamB
MKPRTACSLALVAALSALAGCSSLRTVTDFFDSAGKKTKIQGERISIIASEALLSSDPQLAASKMDLPPPKKNAEWPQPGGTPDNVMGNLMADGPLAQVWSASAGKGTDGTSRLTAPPIVAGGLVYVLDAQTHVFAFDSQTGKPVWDKSIAPTGEIGTSPWYSLGLFGPSRSIDPTKGFGGGLAYDGGKIFAATGFGNVIAMDAHTGKQIWNVNTVVPLRSAPVVVDGRVYVITQENETQAHDVNDGRLLWSHHGTVESAGILSSASVGVSGDTVVVPYSSGELFALRAQNGTPSWTDTLTRTGNTTSLTIINDIAGRPVVDRNLVFAVSHSGTLAAINFRSGSRAWTRNIAGIQTPLVAGEYIFIVSTDGQVVCMNRGDGRVRWTTQLPAFGDPTGKRDPIVWTGPLLVSNFLVLVASTGTAELLSPFTGQKLGETAIPDGTFIPPVVANGMMYVLTNEAQLVALR